MNSYIYCPSSSVAVSRWIIMISSVTSSSSSPYLKTILFCAFNRKIKRFQASITDQLSCTANLKLRFYERFVLCKQQINNKFALRNDVRSIFPEEFATKFILKMVLLVAQANNIDTVSRRCAKPEAFKN